MFVQRKRSMLTMEVGYMLSSRGGGREGQPCKSVPHTLYRSACTVFTVRPKEIFHRTPATVAPCSSPAVNCEADHSIFILSFTFTHNRRGFSSVSKPLFSAQVRLNPPGEHLSLLPVLTPDLTLASSCNKSGGS